MNAIFLLLACASPTIAQEIDPAPSLVRTRMFWGDFDRDGRKDVWVNEADGTGRLLRNVGKGEFQDVTAVSGLARVKGVNMGAWSDVDGDGRLDLYLASLRGESRLYVQDAQGTFVDSTAGSGLPRHVAAMHAEWFDVDGDGRIDLHLITPHDELIYRNLPTGGFAKIDLALRPHTAVLGTPALESANPTDATNPTAPVAPNGAAFAPVASQPGAAIDGRTAPGSPPTIGFGGPDRTVQSGSGCAMALLDQANPTACISASSIPTLGLLFPMSVALNVTAAGDVGIGTTTPAARLDVMGDIAVGGTRIIDASGDWVGDPAWPHDGGVGNVSSSSTSYIGGGENNSTSVTRATISGGLDNTVDGSRGTIGGGEGNQIGAKGLFATIAGGHVNEAAGSDSAIGGGHGNLATQSDTTVAGGRFNTASGYRSTVGGGIRNEALAGYGTVAGGDRNTATGAWASVGGGRMNNAGSEARVGGGKRNTASGSSSFLGGGEDNLATGGHSALAGGLESLATGRFSSVGGGYRSRATGRWSRVGGGEGSSASGAHSTVGGGFGNGASGSRAAITGGKFNGAEGEGAFIGGGVRNQSDGRNSVVAGGEDNAAVGLESTIGGGDGNLNAGFRSTIAGGESNELEGERGTIGGGHLNRIMAPASEGTIAGGKGNTILGPGEGSAIGGGHDNRALADDTTIGGGRDNFASGVWSTIGGGKENTASLLRSTVCGGGQNTASGESAIVAGGLSNIAAGDHSFAAGRLARALHRGSFVWGDSQDEAKQSSTENEFSIFARGGIRMFGDDIANPTVVVDDGRVGIGTASPSEELHVDGDICATGSIGSCSDARFKTNVTPIEDALAKVLALRGVQYDWRADEFPERTFSDERQVGFLAQEIAEVLPEVVSRGDDGYYTVSYGKLTPILVEAIQEQERENAALRSRVEALEKLAARIEALEAR